MHGKPPGSVRQNVMEICHKMGTKHLTASEKKKSHAGWSTSHLAESEHHELAPRVKQPCSQSFVIPRRRAH